MAGPPMRDKRSHSPPFEMQPATFLNSLGSGVSQEDVIEDLG